MSVYLCVWFCVWLSYTTSSSCILTHIPTLQDTVQALLHRADSSTLQAALCDLSPQLRSELGVVRPDEPGHPMAGLSAAAAMEAGHVTIGPDGERTAAADHANSRPVVPGGGWAWASKLQRGQPLGATSATRLCPRCRSELAGDEEGGGDDDDEDGFGPRMYVVGE